MNQARAVWFATVLVVLAGYVGIVRAGEARIAEQRAAVAEIAAHLDADELRLRAQATVEDARTRLRRRVRRFALDGDEAVLVARFVHDAARIATRDRLRVVTIAADPTLAPDGQAPTTQTAFAVTPLDVTLEGGYADLLHGVRDLSRGPVLARVTLDGLTRTHRDGPGTSVTATLHVLVEHLRAEGDDGDRARHA
jgi:Tfp pilus assembly protein PilO